MTDRIWVDMGPLLVDMDKQQVGFRDIAQVRRTRETLERIEAQRDGNQLERMVQTGRVLSEDDGGLFYVDRDKKKKYIRGVKGSTRKLLNHLAERGTASVKELLKIFAVGDYEREPTMGNIHRKISYARETLTKIGCPLFLDFDEYERVYFLRLD